MVKSSRVVMEPRLYLETTIPSYLAARSSKDLRLAADQQSTLEWWENRRQEYELFISEAVLDEIAGGNPVFAARRATLIEGLQRLRATVEVDGLVARLLTDQIIPAQAAPDAVHLALAAVHQMDFLITWNCRHLHNPRLERRIEAACRACGFVCPVICTPAELL